MIEKVEKIDVSDLPDEEISILKKLIALFREREQKIQAKETKEYRNPNFIEPRNLGAIKGNLSREEIYDYL